MISKEQLSEIHAQFRRQMNADISASLRDHGLEYRLAFGVPSMRLKEVAALYAPSVELAETLWNEDIRESKMLATRLFPLEEMTREKAGQWCDAIRYTEIADQACMNLFARLPFAEELVMDWITSSWQSHPMKLYCALKIADRLSLHSKEVQDRARQILDECPDMQIKTAAYWLTPEDPS